MNTTELQRNEKPKLTNAERLRAALIALHEKLFFNGLLRPEYREEILQCPACGVSTVYSSEIYSKDGFPHHRCEKCTMVYVNPRLNRKATIEYYNSEVNEIYNEEKFHLDQTSVMDDKLNTENYNLLKENIHPTGKRLLEIGPGRGTFLSCAKNDGFEVHAIELNKGLIERLKKVTPHVYESDILDIDLPENYFDVIYSRDVIEHIPNVEEFLSRLYKIMKPGGLLFFDTPNIDSIVNKATKEYHTIIFGFEHPVQWSPHSLTIAASRVGFRRKKLYYDHKHQSLSKICAYYLYPTFTYIFPPKREFKFLKALFWLVQRKYIWWVDDRGMKFLSRVLGKGAVQKLMLSKP